MALRAAHSAVRRPPPCLRLQTISSGPPRRSLSSGFEDSNKPKASLFVRAGKLYLMVAGALITLNFGNELRLALGEDDELAMSDLVAEGIEQQQQLEFYGLWQRAARHGTGGADDEAAAIEREMLAKEHALQLIMKRCSEHEGLKAALGGAASLAATSVHPQAYVGPATEAALLALADEARSGDEREAGGGLWLSHFVLTPAADREGKAAPAAEVLKDGVARCVASFERKPRSPSERADEWVVTSLETAVFSGEPAATMVQRGRLPHGLQYVSLELTDVERR